MIGVKVDPFGVFELEFQEDETVGNMVQRFKDQEKLRFVNNGFQAQATDDGRVLDVNEIVVDDRLYQVNAWIEQ